MRKSGGDTKHVEFRLHGTDLGTALRIYNVLHDKVKDFADVLNNTVGRPWHERPEYYGEIGSGGLEYSVRVHKTKAGKEVYEVWVLQKNREVMW